mmetsp:Transcript_8625/g.12684  ORF Transcript_8625/g.12684 Transcript_8625/m.12684 type:complete len:240 (+) Transcript_8625:226-945(+)
MLNAETAACNRLLMIVFVLCHRLFQIFDANHHDHYSSLRNYRHAASARTTFHLTLLHCDRIFKSELLQNPQQQSPRTPTNNQQRQPSRRRVDGMIPQVINFGTNLSIDTPRKIGSMVRAGKAPREIQQMVRKCNGKPMMSQPHVEKRCSWCKKRKTAWYCVGCKRWLCTHRRNTKNNQKKTPLYLVPVQGKDMTFQQCCFQITHEEAWGRDPGDDLQVWSGSPDQKRARRVSASRSSEE